MADESPRQGAIDYGLTSLSATWRQVPQKMDVMVKEGIPSFKLSCVSGRVQVDDGSIFKALSRTAENGGLICMHAENGGVIDVS